MFTSFDIILIIIGVAAVVMGYRRGIITQAGAIAGIVLGIVLCRLWGGVASQLIAGTGQEPSYVDVVVGRVVLFLIGYLGVRLVARLFRAVTQALCLGFLDRLAGAAFTLFEWMLVVSLALNLWLVLKPQTDTAALSTLFHQHAFDAVLSLAPAVMGFISE